MRDYQIASPSLEGVLNHSSILYDGIKRPLELLRVLDGPAIKGQDKNDPTKFDRHINQNEIRILDEYFHDLHEVFMKKLSLFVVSAHSDSDETIKMQAMLQEMIRIKRLIAETS
jgi:hypothetical protein